jgi:iron complex transport system permease protein
MGAVMPSPPHQAQRYKRRLLIRNTVIVASFALVLLGALALSMNSGYTRLLPGDIVRILLGGGTRQENLVLLDFRLPRIVLSSLVGMGLACSGCIIQGISRNGLADPGILGINAGAGLMVILYVLLFGTTSFLALFTLPFLALVGAGAAAVVIYLIAFKRGEGVAPIRLIISGLAMQAGIVALTTLLVVKLDETQFDFWATWEAGSIWGSNWKFVLTLLPWLLVLLPYVLSKARTLDILNMGDDTASGLGVPVERERRRLLAVSVALAATCVAVSGSISFVGLIAPHLARRLVGPRHAILLPTCALAGAVLLTVADTVSRVAFQPSEIPTGIVVAVVGAPYFLYLLATSRQ